LDFVCFMDRATTKLLDVPCQQGTQLFLWWEKGKMRGAKVTGAESSGGLLTSRGGGGFVFWPELGEVCWDSQESFGRAKSGRVVEEGLGCEFVYFLLPEKPSCFRLSPP
jgi:hypothetical protein